MRHSTTLASDADRDAAAAALGDHVAEGRITLEEFRARLDQVYDARTHADLDRAMTGLPGGRGPYASAASGARWSDPRWAGSRRDGPGWAGLGWVAPARSPEERRARLAARYRRGWVRFARVNAVLWALWVAADLVAAHGVALFPLLLTIPWGVARLLWAPRLRTPSGA